MSYFESMIWSVSHCKGKYPIAKGTPRKINIQIQVVLKTTLYQYVFLFFIYISILPCTCREEAVST